MQILCSVTKRVQTLPIIYLQTRRLQQPDMLVIMPPGNITQPFTINVNGKLKKWNINILVMRKHLSITTNYFMNLMNNFSSKTSTTETGVILFWPSW